MAFTLTPTRDKIPLLTISDALFTEMGTDAPIESSFTTRLTDLPLYLCLNDGRTALATASPSVQQFRFGQRFEDEQVPDDTFRKFGDPLVTVLILRLACAKGHFRGLLTGHRDGALRGLVHRGQICSIRGGGLVAV